MLEGEATFTDGAADLRLGAGDIAVVPAGQPQGFVNSGAGTLRQVDVHASGSFATDWLERRQTR